MNYKLQIISHLIGNEQAYFRYADRLHLGLFDDNKSRGLFEAYLAVIKENKHPDVAAISLQHPDENAFLWITDIATSVNYQNDIPSLLVLVEDDYNRMEMMKLSQLLTDTTKSGMELLEIAKAKIFDLNASTPKSGVWVSTVSQTLFKSIEESFSGGIKPGIPSGMDFYDRRTGGYAKTDLVIIAAKTSMGKTSLALFTAKCAAKAKVPVAIFSMEMGDSQLVTRMLSAESNIGSRDINARRIDKYKLDHIKEASKDLINSPILIDSGGTKLDYILNAIRKYSVVYNIKVFIIDYLQLVQNSGKGKSREQEVGEIARAFKNIAKELAVVVIALSQLSRDSDRGQKLREPVISDLRDSGQIEEAADVIILLHRPEVYQVQEFEDGTPSSGKVKIIVGKGRSVGIFAFYMDYEADLTRFSNEEKDHVQSVF